MGNNMKKNHCGYSLIALAMLAMSGSAAAADLNVNFTANIRETTCDMKLVGDTGSDTQQTLTIGNNGQVRLDDVKAGTANANFKIVLVECPASLTSLKTKVSGTRSGYLYSGLINQIQKSTEVQTTLLLRLPEPAHRMPRLSLTLRTITSAWSGVRQKSRIRKLLWWPPYVKHRKTG